MHVVEQVAEPEVAEVDELGGDALAVHVGEAEHRVVQPVELVAVRVLELGQASSTRVFAVRR